jgi:hypothetical protein
MSEIEAVARGLLELDEDDLTAKLGLLEPELNSGSRSATSIDDLIDLPVPRAGLGNLLKAGQNIFGPASAGAYKVLCSDMGDLAKDSDLAKELTKLMDQKTTEASAKVAALLTPFLAGGGLPQSLAVIVGALLVKKLAKDGSDLICTRWKNNIEGTPENTPPASESPAN